MPWVRLDEEFPDHPKVVTAGPLAGWLHVCALAYCNRMMTDGFVPMSQVRRLVDFDGVVVLDATTSGGVLDAPEVDARALAETLVSVGMWERRQGGYLIHDFLDYQPSRAEIEAQRKVKSEAGKAGGRRSGEARRSRNEAEREAETKHTVKHNGSRTEAEPEAHHEAKGEAKTKPDPVPDPFKHRSLRQHHGVPPASADDDESLASTAAQARSLIADRRIAASAVPITNPRAYRSIVLRDVNAKHGSELRRLAAEGLEAEAIADAVEPAEAPAAHPVPSSLQPWDEQPEPAFDIVDDDEGRPFAVPRRVG